MTPAIQYDPGDVLVCIKPVVSKHICHLLYDFLLIVRIRFAQEFCTAQPCSRRLAKLLALVTGLQLLTFPICEVYLFEAGPIQKPTLMRITCMMLAETSVQSKLTRLNRIRIHFVALLDHLGLEQVVVTLCQKRKIPAQLAG